MNLNDYQQWVRTFYQGRGWYDYNAFIRMNFLNEEIGELAQAIRKYEIGRDRPDEAQCSQATNLAHIEEELGDVLDNVLILIDKYDFNFDELIGQHIKKFNRRYEEQA